MKLLDRLVQRRRLGTLRVRRLDLRPRGSSLGVRILLLSDLHARNDWFPRADVAAVVDAINGIESVDLVAMVGDFVGDDITAIDWASEELQRITAPMAAVLGNHDHWTDAARVEQTLADAGAHVLTNRAMPLHEIIGRPLAGDPWLAGIDSCWTRRGTTGQGARPDAAFADVPASTDVVVLGHEPWLATMHEHVLHLAGHTHCGQVRTPVLGDLTARMHMPRYSEPYPTRLYELPVEHGAAGGSLAEAGAGSGAGAAPDGIVRRTHRDRRWVYVTAGVGFSTVPVRVLCPPEIVVIDA